MIFCSFYFSLLGGNGSKFRRNGGDHHRNEQGQVIEPGCSPFREPAEGFAVPYHVDKPSDNEDGDQRNDYGTQHAPQ